MGNDVATVHRVCFGIKDALTKKEGQDGVEASFKDGSYTHVLLSWKSFRLLCEMKHAENEKKAA